MQTNDYGILHVAYTNPPNSYGGRTELPDVKLKVNISSPVDDYWIKWFNSIVYPSDRLNPGSWIEYKKKIILTLEIEHAFPKEISDFNFNSMEALVTLSTDSPVKIVDVKIENYHDK